MNLLAQGLGDVLIILFQIKVLQIERHASVALLQSQDLMHGHALGREPLADAEPHGAVDVLENRHVAPVGSLLDVDAHITVAEGDIAEVHHGVARTAADGDDGALALVEHFQGRGVGDVVALAGMLGQIEGLEVLLPRHIHIFVLHAVVVGLEAVGKALGGPDHGLVLGIGDDECGKVVDDRQDGAGLVHRPVVGQVERGAAGSEGLGRLQVEQVGVGIAVEEVAVLADVVVVARRADDEQAAHGVVQGLAHRLEHALQVAAALLVARRRELHGAQAVLGCRLLHALVNQVVVRAVAQRVLAINHGDERRRARLRLVRIPLIDGVALLRAGGEHHHGGESNAALRHQHGGDGGQQFDVAADGVGHLPLRFIQLAPLHATQGKEPPGNAAQQQRHY